MRSTRTHRVWFAAAVLPLSLSVLLCGSARAGDEFEGISCGSDIRKALIGRRFSDERVSLIEKRHSDLGLKDLGGTEISGRLFLISWRICGNEYEFLLSGSRIRDVMLFPSHSPKAPQVIGSCEAEGRQVPGTIVAVLDNGAGFAARGASANEMLPATAAWRVDEKKERFVEYPTAGLKCRLGDVITADGGS